MKQVLQDMRNGRTIVAEVPQPTPQPGMVLVRTAVSLVSAGTERMVVEFGQKSLLGKARARPDLVRQVLDKARREGLLTTLEAAANRLDQPLPLGYSSAGEVMAVGDGVSGYLAGQRVACAGGGYAVHAEFNLVPPLLVTPLPEQVDYESAAFATLGAIALHGFRLAEPQLGERVAVIGLGLLGLLAVGIARAAGCRVFGVDLDPWRVEMARQLGANAVVRPDAAQAADTFSEGRGCDAVLICADTSSADPVELAGVIARDRAQVVAVGAVGLQLPRKIYYEKELTFINSRSYGPGRYDPAYEQGGRDYPIGYVRWTEGRNLSAFVDLLASEAFDVKLLITHRFPIEQAPAAYALITGKQQQPFLGVLLTYPSTQPAQNGALAAAQAPSTLASLPETGMAPGPVPRVKLGVLGAGNFANAVLLPVLQRLAEVELIGVVSGAGLHAQHAAQKFGFRYAAASLDEILADPEVNSVAILTRHHWHASQVLAALAAGKHVFCEKPLALNAEQLSEIEAALLEPVAGRRPLLMVGFNRRFAPLARQMKRFLGQSQAPLVAHYRINAGYIPLDHWVHDPDQGGGRIIGEVCHFVDFLTYLVDAPPVEVFAAGLPDGGRYREDNVILQFRFPDGSLGTVSYLANGDKAFPKERVEAFSAGRIAVLDDFRRLEMVTDGRRRVQRSRLRQDKGHQAEWEAFSQAVCQAGEPPVPYEHIFGVTQATFVAVRALRGGKPMLIPARIDPSVS